MTPILFEFLKLLLQFVGALIVAKTAVRWALLRFKSEKTWERQASALVDVVSAMSAMKRIVSAWLDEHYREFEPSPEQSDRLLEQYREAHRRFNEVAALARLILPLEIAEYVAETEYVHRTIESNEYEQMTYLENEHELLKVRSDHLIRLGRKLIGDFADDQHPDLLANPIEWVKYRNRVRLGYLDKP